MKTLSRATKHFENFNDSQGTAHVLSWRGRGGGCRSAINFLQNIVLGFEVLDYWGIQFVELFKVPDFWGTRY